jgi:hypothetical protein
MADPLNRVSPGDGLVITAQTWNLLMETAQKVRNEHAVAGLGEWVDDKFAPANVIRVENTTETTWPPHTILTPTAAIVSPGESPLDARRRPVMSAAAPASDQDPIVITFDSIQSNQIGRAVATGVTVALVDVIDDTHQYARPVAGDATMLRSAEDGPVRLLLPVSSGSGSGSGSDGSSPQMTYVLLCGCSSEHGDSGSGSGSGSGSESCGLPPGTKIVTGVCVVESGSGSGSGSGGGETVTVVTGINKSTTSTGSVAITATKAETHEVNADSDLALSGSEQDVPGASITFNLAVTANATITASVLFQAPPTGFLGDTYECRLAVDGSTLGKVIRWTPGFADAQNTPAGSWLVALSAGTHTIKLRGIQTSGLSALPAGSILAQHTGLVLTLHVPVSYNAAQPNQTVVTNVTATKQSITTGGIGSNVIVETRTVGDDCTLGEPVCLPAGEDCCQETPCTGPDCDSDDPVCCNGLTTDMTIPVSITGPFGANCAIVTRTFTLNQIAGVPTASEWSGTYTDENGVHYSTQLKCLDQGGSHWTISGTATSPTTGRQVTISGTASEGEDGSTFSASQNVTGQTECPEDVTMTIEVGHPCDSGGGGGGGGDVELPGCCDGQPLPRLLYLTITNTTGDCGSCLYDSYVLGYHEAGGDKRWENAIHAGGGPELRSCQPPGGAVGCSITLRCSGNNWGLCVEGPIQGSGTCGFTEGCRPLNLTFNVTVPPEQDPPPGVFRSWHCCGEGGGSFTAIVSETPP